jgi:hypothetical protein
LRNLPVVGLSGNGDVAFQEFIPFSDERDITWSARYVSGDVPPSNNQFTLWFQDHSGGALAIFTAPTLVFPP